MDRYEIFLDEEEGRGGEFFSFTEHEKDPKGDWCKWEDVQRELKEAKASADHWDNESHKEVSRLQRENERLRDIDEGWRHELYKFNEIVKQAIRSNYPKEKMPFELMKDVSLYVESLLTKEKN